MESCTTESHTASVVAQDLNRVLDLGRGSNSKNILQSPPNHKSHSLKIIQCNLNGIGTRGSRIKLEEMLHRAEERKADVICIQETKLRPEKALKLNGYKLIRKDRAQGRGGGGLLTLIKELKFEEIIIPPTNQTEIQGIKLYQETGEPILLFNIYHPPDKPGPELQQIIHLLTDKTILLGDFNSKHPTWGCNETNNCREALSNYLDNTDLLCISEGPTYVSNSYGTPQTLDLVITTPQLAHQTLTQVLEGVGSDHLPLLTTTTTEIKEEALPKKLYWNYRKADWTKFRQESNLTPKITNDKQQLNSKWKKWKTTVLIAAKKTIPRGNRKQYIPGYIETINSLQNEITQRNQAQEYLMENNELENKINLSKLSAQVRQKANQLKQRKWRDICSNLGPHTRDTKLWKLIKSINQETPYSTTSNTFTDKDGNILTERTQISNLFADYYTQISKLNFMRQDKKVLHISKKIRNEAKTTSHQDLFHKPFLPHELKEAINRLDDNKTPGSDIISAKMIKHLETNAILELLHIINLSWSSSTLPKEWKHAIIIPIHKAGKTENHPQSYRPISLTSIPCKLMERMILNRMQYFLNKNKLLTKQQAAFKKYHNTVDQIFYFTQKIQDNFQSKPTKSTIAAFIDLSQAFDRVWKERLIKKLDKQGIRGKMMGWIGSFLTGRTFQVNFKEQLSKTGRLFQGLPQGSILSPLLFSIYLNDMDSRITKYCDFALYADDIIIWSSKRDLKEANKNVNKALKELQYFAEKMKLIINPNKSEVGVFTINNHLKKWTPNIKYDSNQIKFSRTPKYLGVTLDPSLTYGPHINQTVLRAKKRLNILKRISGYEWGADRNTLRQTYLALIRPILEYAQPVWQTASKTNLNKIDQVQSSAARIICGLRNTCPTKIAEIEANLLPLTHRRKIGLADYIYKRVNAPKSHRTGEFIRKWKPKTRLKRLSPMHLAYRELLPNSTRNRNAQNQYAPYKERPEISYNLDLEQECSKRADHPGLLRSLAMERIERADKETIQIYTDGSLVENGSSGSGVLILKDSMEIKRRIKNPKNLSELTAILQALKLVEKNETKNIIIYTDSKAAIFAIKNCYYSQDRLLKNIAAEINKLNKNTKISLQWIPSHVGVPGNEEADRLAKEGAAGHPDAVNSETYLSARDHTNKLKLQLIRNHKDSFHHSWYQAENLKKQTLQLNRRESTQLARWKSGHLRPLVYKEGAKSFPMCTRCKTEEATPQHLLNCIGKDKRSLYSEPRRVLELLYEHDLQDLV
ncbi:hypothetical protein LAZ67_8000346 [Cordylochernes scorpioides]|uniref:Uncharacterized protein n=1 Tax=Cordylochernes scorpioides TaxID=51811 RepID=A0ABY6KPG1_9ARAC|nr:hypothetical protein LAZ67_8000346 [Cordylochernes scorpioides]